MDPQKLIERLQGEGAQSLAALSIDSMLDGELGALLTPAVLVSSARSLLQAWLASDGAVKVLNRGVEALAHELQAERRALKDLAPRDVRQADWQWGQGVCWKDWPRRSRRRIARP